MNNALVMSTSLYMCILVCPVYLFCFIIYLLRGWLNLSSYSVQAFVGVAENLDAIVIAFRGTQDTRCFCVLSLATIIISF